jgi:hypothetical protein
MDRRLDIRPIGNAANLKPGYLTVYQTHYRYRYTFFQYHLTKKSRWKKSQLFSFETNLLKAGFPVYT